LAQDVQNSKTFPKDMKIRQLIDQLETKEIIDMRDAKECFDVAQKFRCVGSTSMNSKSSRSHAIFLLHIMNKNNDTRSTLYLVDLAGSERIKKSNVSGERIDEAIAINSSLTTLAKCIIALGEKKTAHVPFRESKLTRILQDALGGNSKTALILTLSPELDDMEETISSLLFGQRAKKVQCRPIVQVKPDSKSQIEELKSQLEIKNSLLQEVSSENRKLQMEVKSMNTVQSSKKDEQIKRLELKIKIMKKEHDTRLEDMDAIMLQQEKEVTALREKVKLLQSLRRKTEISLKTDMKCIKN
jgi:kinesin family protein 5